MRTIPLGKTGLAVPAVALGCMRLTALDERGGLGHLAERAAVAAAHSANRQLAGLKQLLDAYKDDETAFLKRFITMCSEISESSWSDAAIEKTIYDLPKLSLEFRQAECFADVPDSSKARRMIALTFAASARQDTTLMAEISPDDEALIQERARKILGDLDSLKQEQAIAVIAEIGQLLSKRQSAV